MYNFFKKMKYVLKNHTQIHFKILIQTSPKYDTSKTFENL